MNKSDNKVPNSNIKETLPKPKNLIKGNMKCF